MWINSKFNIYFPNQRKTFEQVISRTEIVAVYKVEDQGSQYEIFYKSTGFFYCPVYGPRITI